MAFKTVSKLILDAARGISPVNPADSKDVLGSVGEAARNILSKVSPKDLSRRVQVENALYDQVNRFYCPPDLSNQSVVQWYTVDENGGVDTFYHPMKQVSNREFDQHNRNGYGNGHGNRFNEFTIEWQSGVKFIKVGTFECMNGAILNRMDSLTDNGTWNVFGNVVNLTNDNLNYVAGRGSLAMDINTSGTTGGIECTGMDPVNISNYFVRGKVFTWVYLPNLNQLQTITLELHSSTGDYYSITVNSPHDTTQFQLGWNLVGFPFDNRFMTITGTPDPSAINSLKITMETNGTLLMNNVRFDNIVIRYGVAYGLQYISDSMFEDANGLWMKEPTDPSNLVHVQDDTYVILLSELKTLLGSELFTGKQGEAAMVRLEAKKERDIKEYKKNNKQEYIVEQQEPYRFGTEFGWGWGGDGWGGHTHREPGWFN